jgi:hypothetical protein
MVLLLCDHTQSRRTSSYWFLSKLVDFKDPAAQPVVPHGSEAQQPTNFEPAPQA